MSKAFPPRPDADFTITSFTWQLDSESNHRRAGFPPVAPDIIARRFWQFLSFLQAHDLALRQVVESAEQVDETSVLRNSDLTDLGYQFAQRYCDRWTARVYRDRGEAKEHAFLVKWYNELLAPRGA